MERLTDKNWRNLDPWECCWQEKYCTRPSNKPGGCRMGCIVPQLYIRLAKYEDMAEQKPRTNADEIWAMTDEELAGYMAKMLAVYTTGLYDGSYVPSDKVVCEMASDLLRQLQQPYESEETP